MPKMRERENAKYLIIPLIPKTDKIVIFNRLYFVNECVNE